MTLKLVNKIDNPVIERDVRAETCTDDELREMVGYVMLMMDIYMVETNATKHGTTEYQFRKYNGNT